MINCNRLRRLNSTEILNRLKALRKTALSPPKDPTVGLMPWKKMDSLCLWIERNKTKTTKVEKQTIFLEVCTDVCTLFHDRWMGWRPPCARWPDDLGDVSGVQQLLTADCLPSTVIWWQTWASTKPAWSQSILNASSPPVRPGLPGVLLQRWPTHAQKKSSLGCVTQTCSTSFSSYCLWSLDSCCSEATPQGQRPHKESSRGASAAQASLLLRSFLTSSPWTFTFS